MSAPPPEAPPTMPTMVSRLPKFNSRPKNCSPPAQMGQTASTGIVSSTRLTNGFYHHPGPAGVHGGQTDPPAAGKQNGFIRVPTSFSAKWRKENEAAEDGKNRSRNVLHQNQSPRQQGYPAPQRDGTMPIMASTAEKGRPSVTSSLPQSSPRSLPVSKGVSTKLVQTSSAPTNGTRIIPNGFSGSKPRSAGSLRPPQNFARPIGSGPGSRSGFPLQRKPPASRSHSSDSLGLAGSAPLSQGDLLRSRSLTQVRRQPSPSLTPPTSSSSSSSSLPRSYSSTRAVAGRGVKELTAPSRGGAVKSPIRPALNIPSLLKKPLLPSHSPASRPSGISYKLSRPSATKPRPLRVTPANENGVGGDTVTQGNSGETGSTTGNSPESSPDAPEKEGLSAELVSQAEVSIVGETLEDMSLSSNSSLDRNDTSQEYMDDFDNLGNGGVGILLLSSTNDEEDSGLDKSCTRFNDDDDDDDDVKVAVNGVAKATGLCFLDDGVDWSTMRLSGEQRETRLSRLPQRRRSSQPDYHDQGGSSLDLSPSDSCGSGGTYMWDEEGLEPLGGAATTTASLHSNSNAAHHIGSFDSDLNSIDVLNNLDSCDLDCDLDDDDLMLDADVPEDASLHSDGDGISHMAQWRMRQLCWGTQDVHNDNDSDFHCYSLAEDPGNKRKDKIGDSDLILDLCPQRSPGTPGSPGLGLDVEELAEDCSAVRSQLEYLQMLLLQEEEVDDDTLTTDTLSPEMTDSSRSCDSQVQVLLQEVQQLREELRSRDRTIAQLTLQLTCPTATTRCRCQETAGTRTDRHTQTSVTEKESVGSQTPWGESTSQVLHSSGPDNQEPLTDPCQAQPPADSRSTAATTTNPPLAEGARKDPGRKGRRGTFTRSPQLPRPSKLRLFLSHAAVSSSSSPLPSPQTPPPKTKEMNGMMGSKVKAAALSSGSSRLPKPKSH